MMQPEIAATRRAVAVTLAVLALALAVSGGCFNADGDLSGLFGAPKDDNPGDGPPGVGGTVKMLEFFLGAQLETGKPEIVDNDPPDRSNAIPVSIVPLVAFSESMESGIRSNISLFPLGSANSVAGTVQLLQHQTLAVFVPDSNLLGVADYELSIAGNSRDLSNESLEIPEGQLDVRFGFQTASETTIPVFEVVYNNPVTNSPNIPRNSEVVIVFSEAVNIGSGPTGLFGPGNLTVTVGGVPLDPNTGFAANVFPATTQARVLQIVPTDRFPASTKVTVAISDNVKTIDGERSLLGGRGFTLEFTSQDFQVPDRLEFPNNMPVGGAAGVIGSDNLHMFPTDVLFTLDGVKPARLTLYFFDDPAREQALVEERINPSTPAGFISDLQPEPEPALLDGEILVGTMVQGQRGHRSGISVIARLVKDTVGPTLVELGPPALNVSGSAVFYSTVNEPVIYGRMDEACRGVDIDFDGDVPSDFTTVQLRGTQSTVEDNFFITGVSQDAPLTPQLEPRTVNLMTAGDIFGNVVQFRGPFNVTTVGVVGADVTPDGNTALAVQGYPRDQADGLFQPLTNGAVLLDRFPPDPGGADQQIFSMSAGTVLISETDLASVATSQVTVTLVAAGYNLLTVAGIDKPTAASPRAMIQILDVFGAPPAPTVRADFANFGTGAQILIGASEIDLEPTLEPLARTRLIPNPAGDLSLRLLPLNDDRVQIFSGIEKLGASFRYSSSEPFHSIVDTIGGFGQQKARSVDYQGRTGYSGASTLPFSLTFDDSQVIGDGLGNPGPVGLISNEVDQFRRLRMVTRVPGFAALVPVADVDSFQVNTDDRTGEVILPPDFSTNEDPAVDGIEDTALELLLQPSLIDPAVAVDQTLLQRNLRAELMIQDLTEPVSQGPTSGYTRQRFVLNAAVLGPPVFQDTPSITSPLAGSTVPHPPAIDWPEVTSGEAVHVLRLISSGTLRWRVYHPANASATPISFQMPLIPSDPQVPANEFQVPGAFNAYVESFDFDPLGIYSSGDPVMPYEFDFNRFFQTDLEREHLRSSRSDPVFGFTTN